MAAGARGGSSSRGSSSYKNCWPVTLQAVCRPGALQQLAAGQAADSKAAAAAAALGAEAAQGNGEDAGAASAAAAVAAAAVNSDSIDGLEQQRQQQERNSRSSSSSSFSEAAATLAGVSTNNTASNSCTDEVVSHSFTYMVSAVFEVLPAVVESALTTALAGAAAGSGARPASSLVAAVAVCTKSDGSAAHHVTSTGGEL
jgi:hypothetical protein